MNVDVIEWFISFKKIIKCVGWSLRQTELLEHTNVEFDSEV